MGDRGWGIRDDATGEIHNAKRHPILMQCSAVYRAAPRADHIPQVDITLPEGTTVSSDSQPLSELIGRFRRQRGASYHPLRDADARASRFTA